MHAISQYYIADAARKASQNHIQNTVQRLERAHPFAASRDYSILIFMILVPSGVDLGVDKPVSYFVGNESVFSDID